MQCLANVVLKFGEQNRVLTDLSSANCLFYCNPAEKGCRSHLILMKLLLTISWLLWRRRTTLCTTGRVCVLLLHGAFPELQQCRHVPRQGRYNILCQLSSSERPFIGLETNFMQIFFISSRQFLFTLSSLISMSPTYSL